MNGTVTAFDDFVGLGSVEAENGVTYAFHCTQITGGTRSIAPDTAVTFEVVPGRLGRWEAAAVTAVTPPP
jgi:cold shock protein